MKQTGIEVVATNRQARYRYTLGDSYEAGIVLTGSEVKSLREGQVQLNEAWASIDAGEAWLHGMHIAPYSHAQAHSGHNPMRKRKLLLHREEIEKLHAKVREKGLSLIPTKLYLKNGKIKCEVAVARGKKMHDKREAERAREDREEARQAVRRSKANWD